MTSEHVEGEDDGTAAIVDDACEQFSRFAKARKLPVWVRSLVSWVARESFRAGFQRAHQRKTIPQREAAIQAEELVFDDETPVWPTK